MQKFIYKTDFSDLSQSLKEFMISTIIEKKFKRGDYDHLDNDLDQVKNLEDAKNNLHLIEEIENELNVDIVVNY